VMSHADNSSSSAELGSLSTYKSELKGNSLGGCCASETLSFRKCSDLTIPGNQLGPSATKFMRAC
jgi:hypothetical protein